MLDLPPLFENWKLMRHFIIGMLLCELDILARNNELPRFIKMFEPYKTPIYYTLFVIGMFLSGVPSHGSKSFPRPKFPKTTPLTTKQENTKPSSNPPTGAI